MQKRKKGRKLSRKRDQRWALLKTLANSLLWREKIQTTEAKAKEIAMFAEKFITLAKKQDLASRRTLARSLSPKVVKKLMAEITPRYQSRNGGYTRIVKLGPRKSDGAKMAFIELIK